MSLDDFERCTPSEFSKICEAYHRKELEAMALKRWEVAMLLQPYCKKTLSPKDILSIPELDMKTAPDVGKEEAQKRFEQLMAERNGK